MKLPFLSGHTPPKPSWYPPLLVIWEPLPQHLSAAAAVPRTAQGTDTQPGQKGGQGMGWQSRGWSQGRAERDGRREGKSGQECADLVSMTLRPRDKKQQGRAC